LLYFNSFLALKFKGIFHLEHFLLACLQTILEKEDFLLGLLRVRHVALLQLGLGLLKFTLKDGPDSAEDADVAFQL